MTEFRCPRCGATLRVDAADDLAEQMRAGMGMVAGPTLRGAGSRREYRAYGRGAVAAADGWSEISYEAPARQASREADVSVPVLQALISGAFAGAMVIIVATALAIHNRWTWYVPPLAGLVAAVAVAAISWRSLLTDSRGLLRRMETYVVQPAPQTPTAPSLSVEVRDDRARFPSWSINDLPCEKATLRAIARAYTAGLCRLSRRDLRRFDLGDDRARALLEALSAGGFIRRDGNTPTGATLTARGKALFRGVAE